MTGTHEIHSPKGPLERVLCRLSIKTSQMDREGGTGQPEYSVSDLAAMASGVEDPLAGELLPMINGDPSAKAVAIEELAFQQHLMIFRDWPDRSVAANKLRRMARAAVREYVSDNPKGLTVKEAREIIKVSGSGMTKITPFYMGMIRRLHVAEGELVSHLRRQFAREAA